MARIALIKPFTGLNLAVAQLAGQLQRAGHETIIVYFKDFLVIPVEDAPRYLLPDYALTLVTARGREYNGNGYRPVTAHEYELLFDVLREFKPDLIGFSLTSLTIKFAADVTRELKTQFDTPIIWGGPGPSIEPEYAIEHADMVCVGEGEELIVELAERLAAGADVSDIKSLWLRRPDREIVRNPAGPMLNLESIAIPDFEPTRTLHIGDDQLRRNFFPVFIGTQYPIMSQRGCPFSCSFCIESVYQDMFGKKDSLRRRSVDVVIEELVQARKRYGIRQVMFYDDVFTVNPRWLREFAPRYKAEVGLPFWCYTYPTTTRKEDILLLKDAGMSSITMGIQTGSERILREDFNRPVARQKSIEAAQTIIDCGVECFFDLITKVHFETDADCRETFDFLVDFPQPVRTIGFGAMVSFPKFGYTEKVRAERVTPALSQKDYDYYHRLYLLTRTKLPRQVVRAIGKLPLLRSFPQLMDPLLPKELPVFFLVDEMNEYVKELMDNGQVQAVIPGGRLDRGAPAEMNAA